MKREELLEEDFQHLVDMIRGVFAAEACLCMRGEFSYDAVKGKFAEWYCEKVAEELISKTDASELANENENANENDHGTES